MDGLSTFLETLTAKWLEIQPLLKGRGILSKVNVTTARDTLGIEVESPTHLALVQAWESTRSLDVTMMDRASQASVLLSAGPCPSDEEIVTRIDALRDALLQHRQEQRQRVRHVLFICSRNQLRSPTAEKVFSVWPGIEVASAGLDPAADEPVTPELLLWADLIFVMEKVHRKKLSAKFGAHLNRQRVICLDIADDYEYMEPALIELLKKRVGPHLGMVSRRVEGNL